MKDLDSTLGHRGHRRSGKAPLLLHQVEPLRQLVSAELLNVSGVEVRSARFKKVYHRPLVLKCFFYDRIKIWRKNHLKLKLFIFRVFWDLLTIVSNLVKTFELSF